VEFQIEKNPSAQCRDLFYGGRAARRKETGLPILNMPHKIGDLLCEFHCAGKESKSRADDQAAARMASKVRVIVDPDSFGSVLLG